MVGNSDIREFDKVWESLQIKNDYIFSKVMRDKKICIALLEKLLKLKIRDIKYLEEEKAIDIEYVAKSVRLDVYVEEDNRVFNLEMQATSKKEMPYRSRYYQGIIDLNSIEKGARYKELKESYIIFICTFDPFKKRRARYTFENLCIEDNKIQLKDGTKKIFFNSTDYEKEEDKDVREFLRYVNGEKSDNSFVKVIDDEVIKVKSSEEWRREYMTLLMREEDIRDETREKDIKISVEMLKSLQIPEHVIAEQLMDKFNLTEDEALAFID